MKLSDWALAYHELGWPVVPISADKKPLVKWREYQTEPQTPEMIEQWWADYPTAGIAIITGRASGLVIIDCDDETAIAAVERAGIDSPVRSTTSRGRHILFRHPGFRVKNATNWRGMSKVDVRGDGGLFKVYPSRGYAWDLPIGVKVSDIPHELPTWPFSEEVENGNDIDLSDIKGEIPAEIAEGGRNSMMTRVVGQLIKKDPALWGKNLAIQAWAENLKRCNPPLGQEEIKTIVRSVMEMHQRNNPEEFNEEGQRRESLLSDMDRMVRDNFKLLFECDSISLTGEPPEREWLVRNIIPAGLPGVLASPGGVGKTFMLLDLALKVACPHPHDPGTFLGHAVAKHGKVVMFLAEDDRHEIMRRMEALDPHYSRIFYPERLSVVSVPELEKSINFGTKKYDSPMLTPEADSWYQTLTQIDDLALVVFDPLQSFFDWRFDEDNVAADRALKWAQSIAVRTGAAVIFTHHLRKEDVGHQTPTTPQGAVSKIRGASNVVNSARFAIPIWRPSEEVHGEVCERLGLDSENNMVFMAGLGKENFGGDVSTHWLVRDEVTGLLHDRTEDLGGGPRKKRTVEERVEHALLENPRLTPKQIVIETGVSRSRMKDVLSALLEARRIHKVGRGEYAHCRNHDEFAAVRGDVLDYVLENAGETEHGASMVALSRNMRSSAKKMLFREAVRDLVALGEIKIKRIPADNGRTKKYLYAATERATEGARLQQNDTISD